jgi:acyl carrier protein
LINGYGPTENTTFTCCHTIHGNSELNGSIPIGVPVANSRAYLLDQHFRPVPVGVRGELYAAGDGLARDYLNRPELTAEKFVPNPFGQPGERAYRTGDIASYRANGQIEFMGRRDDQLKVRGFRIEPGEIEAVVGSHPAVREVVVLAREDSTGQKQLVCYAVLDSSIGAGTGDWRAFLKQRLPDYMIPSWFEIIEQLPVTPNGKVDRKALLELRAMRHAEGLVHPRTPVEEIIASMWKEVLKLEGDVGVDDDFFELGGHSLLATQVVSRLRAIFYVDIPLRDLFQTPTIAALAELIEKAKDARPSAGISPISRLDRNAYRIKTSPPAPQAPADRV